jgi:uncharacterized membrane protein
VKRNTQSDLTFGEKIADSFAKFGGSWTFIISFLMIMALWIIVNIKLLSHPFDRYPFILLNLVLSCLAALQAPVIMMSQNRQETKDREHADSDYKINILAEQEIRILHEKLDRLQTSHDQALLHIRVLLEKINHDPISE